MTDNDLINKVFLKPDYDTRTFESRLLFIKDLFEHTFDNSIIMGRCIQYKLNESYNTSEKERADSIKAIKQADPIEVLNKIKNF